MKLYELLNIELVNKNKKILCLPIDMYLKLILLALIKKGF